MTKQVVYFDDGTELTLTSDTPSPNYLPPHRKFARLKHDYEIYGVSRPTRNRAANHVLGLPETIKVLEPVFVPMSKEWQFFNLDILSIARYGKLYALLTPLRKEIMRKVFAGTVVGYRAFTNSHGPNNGYTDYVNNIDGEHGPLQQETINTGGNVVELLGDKERKGGKDVYKIRILDGTKPPPDPLLVNHITTPWLVVKATNSQRRKIMDGNRWTGRWEEDIVQPFPQNDGQHNPMGFMGKGNTNYIVAERIEILKPEAFVPSPYHKYSI